MAFLKKQIPWNKGLKTPEETKKKQSLARLGKEPWNKGVHTGIKPWLGKERLNMMGDKNPEWKGDKVGYFALHNWISRQLGKANHCDNRNCIYPRYNSRKVLLKAPKRFEWSNISGLYKRDLSDWQQLCPSCHQKYDRNLLVL